MKNRGATMNPNQNPPSGDDVLIHSPSVTPQLIVSVDWVAVQIPNASENSSKITIKDFRNRFSQ